MKKGQKVPRKKTRGLREKAWWALRRHRAMTLDELLQSIYSGGQKSPANNLRKWLNNLTWAGLLTRERVKLSGDHPNSNGKYCYCLATDPGPKAPVVKITSGTVLDPNTGTSHNIKQLRIMEGRHE